jgi:hypothetical protein
MLQRQFAENNYLGAGSLWIVPYRHLSEMKLEFDRFEDPRALANY